MKRKKIIIISGIILGVVSCTYLVGKKDELKFSHKTHADVDCLICHEAVKQSEEPVGTHYPTEAVCASCHAEDFMKTCENCHTNPQTAKKLVRTQTDVIFSHKAHLERVKQNCLACHDKIPKATNIEESTLAEKESCTACHSAKWHELQCSYCHRRLGTKKLIEVIEFSHKGTWDISCKEFARRKIDMDVCAQCHEESFCANCHSKREVLPPAIKFPESVERDFIHRGDYIERHALELEVDQTLCSSCHGISFCNDCHIKRNIAPSAGRTPINPHPAGWATDHRENARRDITSCASCHNEGKCVGCHKVGGIGGNPHPRGWKTTQSKEKDAVCKNCHYQ